VIDTCDLETPEIRKVSAWGTGEVVGYDVERARRKLARYLGPDEERWRERWGEGWDAGDVSGDPAFVRLVPHRLVVRDLTGNVRPTLP
jgi:hypothetical protein